MATDNEVQVILRAKDELSATLKKIESQMGNVGKSAKSAQGPFDNLFGAIKQGVGIAGGLAIFDKVSSAFSSAAGAAIGFEKSMSGIKAVSGATGQQMEQLSQLALDLGKKTSFSASQAAEGIQELLKGGVSINDVFSATGPTLDLAAAGAVSVGRAAEIAANAMSQFGLTGEDMTNVANKIAGAANASSLEVNDFAMSMSQVGAVARTAGISFDSTAEAIAVLGQAGVKGSDAGTSLKQMLLSLTPATKPAIEEMRRLGILTADGANAFFDATGKAKSLADISQVLQNATKGMTDQQKLASLEILFGSDAMRAAAVFAREGATGFDTMRTAMSKVTAESVAMERLNNVAGDIEQLKGSAETLGIVLVSTVAPAFRTALQAATSFINKITQEAQTIIRTAENIAGAHGLGLIPAALSAIELRVGEVFGSKWQTLFHNARDAVEKAGQMFLDTIGWLQDHEEVVKGVAAAYLTLAGAQGIGAAVGALQALPAVLARVNPLLAGLAITVGLLAAAHEKFPDTVGANMDRAAGNILNFVKMAGETLGMIPGIVQENIDAFNQWKTDTGLALHDLFTALGAFFNNAASAIGQAASNFREDATKLGLAIVDGIIAGLSNPGRVVSAVTNMAASAIAAAKTALGIASPSAVFEAIGEDVGAGFAIGLESVAEALGAILPQTRDIIAQAQADINADIEEENRKHQRALDLEAIKHGRTMADLEARLGRAKGDARKRVQEDIEEENTSHERRLEDAVRNHNDRLVELEYDTADRLADAARRQAEARGAALRDFDRAFDSLVRETEARADEIGRTAGAAIRAAIDGADKAMQEARDRFGEFEEDARSRIGESRILRSRRDVFGQTEQERDRAFREGREDADDEYQWLRAKDKAQANYREALGKARTDEEREQAGIRLTQETQAADRAFEDAKRDRARRRKLDEDERKFRATQEEARRTFEDGLEDEALKKSIDRARTERDTRITAIQDALAVKQTEIEKQEAQERETLRRSFDQKADDLRTALKDKMGPLLGEQRTAFDTFLDGVAKKVAEVALAITTSTGAAIAGIASLAGAAMPAPATMPRLEQGYEIDYGQSLTQNPDTLEPAPPGWRWVWNGQRYELVELFPTSTDVNGQGAGGSYYADEGYPSFAGGGVMPGPPGAARWAMLHGGETVRTPAQEAALAGGRPIIINLNGTYLGDDQYLAQQLARLLRPELERLGGRVVTGV